MKISSRDHWSLRVELFPDPKIVSRIAIGVGEIFAPQILIGAARHARRVCEIF